MPGILLPSCQACDFVEQTDLSRARNSRLRISHSTLRSAGQMPTNNPMIPANKLTSPRSPASKLEGRTNCHRLGKSAASRANAEMIASEIAIQLKILSRRISARTT
jgi:hypothetical protein